MDQHNSTQQSDNQHHGGIDEQQTGFLVGAVMGALMGGAAALLLSPKSGKEMREIVKKYSKELESEAYELAKESRGVAKSFKSVLEDGASEVIDQAPERLEQAGYQAQQLAEDLSHRFESARDVVSELAEAFRSGWEEYGEEHPVDEFSAPAPALFADEQADVEPESLGHEAEEVRDVPAASTPLQSRRRGHVSSAYSMHATKPSAEDKKPKTVENTDGDKSQPDVVKTDHGKESKIKTAVEAKSEAKDEPANKPKYETRVLDKQTPVHKTGVEVKLTEDKSTPASTVDKPKKKLLFRRSK